MTSFPLLIVQYGILRTGLIVQLCDKTRYTTTTTIDTDVDQYLATFREHLTFHVHPSETLTTVVSVLKIVMIKGSRNHQHLERLLVVIQTFRHTSAADDGGNVWSDGRRL